MPLARSRARGSPLISKVELIRTHLFPLQPPFLEHHEWGECEGRRYTGLLYTYAPRLRPEIFQGQKHEEL